MLVFTKINGKLACWRVYDQDYIKAIKTARDDLGVGHRGAILALVKY